MRDSRNRPFPHARVLSGKMEDRLHAVALCGAFLLIAAILLGTASFRPF
jgi:hypothetical protein